MSAGRNILVPFQLQRVLSKFKYLHFFIMPWPLFILTEIGRQIVDESCLFMIFSFDYFLLHRYLGDLNMFR